MVVFDSTILLALLQPDGYVPRHPDTNDPVEHFRERIDYLVSQLEEAREKIIIPTPAISEILIRAESAGPQYLDRINSSSAFRPAPFDEICAVEVAAMTKDALAAGNKRGDHDGTWAKIKYDRQIVAIAKVAGAHVIYSDDKEIYKLGQKAGLTVIRTADLPLPPEDPQGSFVDQLEAPPDGKEEADAADEETD